MKKLTAYDTVGDIAILPYETKNKIKLANEILKNKNIKTVAIKTGLHKGRYRTKEIKILKGINKTETIHKENGILLKLDIKKCYFSPRLSNERLIISKKVKKKETILVLFSGIGPYTILLAKKAKEVYGIEINPTAHKYAQENIKLNKLNNIKLFKGNASKILKEINKKFDRIIMPLPKSADRYLKLTLTKLKKNGIIHFYDFQKKENIKKSEELVKKYCKKCKILQTRRCGMYAPNKYRICVDFKKP